MKSITKKSLSLLLVVLMLVGLMSGCTNTSNNADPTPTPTNAPEASNTPAATDTPTPTPAPTLSPGEQLALEHSGFVETPMDLGGRVIKFVTTIQKRYQLTNDDRDQTPNATLQIVDAIEQLEMDYNCTIEFEQLKGKGLVSALITAKASGEAYCDILEFGVSDTYLEQIYEANVIMPLEDERIADIIKLDTNPWLSASEFGRMFGHQYGVHFKTNNSSDVVRNAILFNKGLVEKYNIGNLYEMVLNKTWTFDKLMEVSASIATQSDGTIYPLVYSKESLFLPMLIYANGGSITEYVDGKYVFTGVSDNTLEALNFAVDMKSKGYIHPISENSTAAEQAFLNGESVFFVGIYSSLGYYTQGTIPCEFEVGLLPGPLGPNTDGKYNGVTYTEFMFHVMNNVEKPEEVAALLVAFANRTGKRNMLETELMNTLQDEESAEMLQMMYDNTRIDYSRAISTIRSLCVNANKAIMNMEATPKEKYEEIASKAQTIFDELELAEETGTTTTE